MKSFEGIPDNPFKYQVRVGYIDTDQGGIVHHSSYVRFLEQARLEWLRAKGPDYSSTEKSGIALPVVDMSIHYKSPAFFDDVIDVSCWVSKLGRSLIRFRYQIHRQKDLLTEAVVSTACVLIPSMRPVRAPQDIHRVCLEEIERHLRELS